MVSKASEDFPEPERPVTQISEFLGRLTVTSLRLCSRAPCTTSWSAAAITPSVAPASGRTRVRFGLISAPLHGRGGERNPDRPAGRVAREDGQGAVRRERRKALVARPRDRADELVVGGYRAERWRHIRAKERERAVQADDHVPAARARLERAHSRADRVEEALRASLPHDLERCGAVGPGDDCVIADAQPGDLAHVTGRSHDRPVAARDLVQALEDDLPRRVGAAAGPLAKPAVP